MTFSIQQLQTRFFAQASPGTWSGNDDGTGTLKGVPIFRAGTFKDSMGYQHTWDPEHLEMMVFNFNLLRSRGIFPDVPVRVDHWSGAEGLAGYFADLRVEDNKLIADFDLTEPDKAAKIQRGTLRSRSAEIGVYETNDEATYWPVLMGVAYVDIPAVEGLFNRRRTNQDDFSVVIEEELNVGDTANSGGKGGTPAPKPAGEQQTGTETPQGTPGQGPGETGGAAEPGQPPAQTQPSSDHSRMQAFQINGHAVTDPVQVQNHITALETSLSEQAQDNRRNFVAKLAEDKKILASQVESLTAHAVGLNPEQFEGFKSAYEGAPSLPMFGAHGSTVAQTDNGQTSAVADATEIDLEVVANHKRAGMSSDRIEKSPAYQRLKAAGKAPSLA